MHGGGAFRAATSQYPWFNSKLRLQSLFCSGFSGFLSSLKNTKVGVLSMLNYLQSVNEGVYNALVMDWHPIYHPIPTSRSCIPRIVSRSTASYYRLLKVNSQTTLHQRHFKRQFCLLNTCADFPYSESQLFVWKEDFLAGEISSINKRT